MENIKKSCNQKDCPNKVCEHRYPHYYMYSCHECTCDYLGNNIKVYCEASLAEVRKEKLKKLKIDG